MSATGSAERRHAERRHAERRRTGAAGFTLVELLVSMVIVAMVVLTTMSGLRLVVRTFAHTDERRAGLEELTLGLAVLRRELERAEPLMRKVRNEDRVLFEGGPERLRFANVEPAFLAGPPYLVYDYAITTSGSTYRLELRRAPLDPGELTLDPVDESEPRTLLQFRQPVRFTYFGQRRDREPPRWHEAWPPGARLPKAIRIATAAEEPGWPDVVIPLRISVPWYCGTAQPASSAGCGQAGEGEARQALGDRDALGERDRRREEQEQEQKRERTIAR